MNTKTGCFYGIGVGPGDPELITLKAQRILSAVPVIFVPKKGNESASYARSIIAGLIRPVHSEPVQGEPGQEVIELVFPMIKDREKLAVYWQQAANTIWSCLEQGKDCAFINLGDPLLYGTFIPVLNILRQNHPEVQIKAVPGISSINAAAAEALIPLAIDDDSVAIISGKCGDDFIRQTLHSFDTVVFMKMHSVFSRLLGILDELELTDRCIYIKRCTTKEEEIVTDIRKLAGEKLDYFSLLIVRR